MINLLNLLFLLKQEKGGSQWHERKTHLKLIFCTQCVISLSLPQDIFIARKQRMVSLLWTVKTSTATLCNKEFTRDSLPKQRTSGSLWLLLLSLQSLKACSNFLQGNPCFYLASWSRVSDWTICSELGQSEPLPCTDQEEWFLWPPENHHLKRLYVYTNASVRGKTGTCAVRRRLWEPFPLT